MALLIVAISPLAAAAAPDQLRGKSVVVGWNEQQRQRNPVTKEERTASIPFVLTVYISTADRVFNRLTVGRAGSSDQSPGAKDSKRFAPRTVNFSGLRMTASNTFTSGGARQIAASFDPGFAGCTGSVIIGRTGAGAIRQRTIAGGEVDVLSTTVGSVSCSISSGNALGGE